MLAEITFEMQLIEVKTKQQENEWVLFPTRLYANDPLFIRSIDQEIKDIFNPDTNRVFNLEKSEAVRWMLQKDGKTIGRISAFINGKTYNSEDQPTGGSGFSIA